MTSSAEALAQALARFAPDVLPPGLDELRALTPALRRRCAKLLERRRAVAGEESCIASALEGAQAELERRMRREWLACVQGEIPHPDGRRQCEAAQHDVERVERALVLARAEIAGIREDLETLLRMPTPTRVSA